ncbi:hypothetical protein Hanom_Chr04g00360771 [Helianthus anomalus]
MTSINKKGMTIKFSTISLKIMIAKTLSIMKGTSGDGPLVSIFFFFFLEVI